jgi:hypothetical protein
MGGVLTVVLIVAIGIYAFGKGKKIWMRRKGL